MKMSTDREWLLKMAAKEDGQHVGVGLQITAFSCPPKCEHVMDGPEIDMDGIYSRSCSRCGVSAFDVSMAEGI